MKKCLICLCVVSTTRSRSHRPKSTSGVIVTPDHSPKGRSSVNEENCPLLDEEVDSFYLTHKLLGVSDEVCGSLLQAHGNPSSWFSLCGDCASRFLDEGKRLFDQIQYLTKLHDDVKKGALERMRVKVEIEVEEETMMMGFIDPGVEGEDDDGALTTIRSYLLPSSVEGSTIDDVHYYGCDDVNNDAEENVTFMEFADAETDELDEECLPPLSLSPTTPSSSPPPSPKVKRGRGRPKGKSNTKEDSNVLVTTRPTGMSRKEKEWKKLYAANKNPVIHKRPKGMHIRTWQRLIRLSKQPKVENDEEDAVEEKLSWKKKRQQQRKIRRNRSLALAAKMNVKVKTRVEAALKEKDDDNIHKKKKHCSLRKCSRCKPIDNDQPPGETMEDHMRRLHTAQESLGCRGCGHVILKVKDYVDHVLKAELENPSSPCVTSALPCRDAVCLNDKVVRATEESLALHYQIDHYRWERPEEGRMLGCDLCGKTFPQKHNRDQHMQRVHIAPLIKCKKPNCSALVRGSKGLNRHLRLAHPPEKALSCPDCGKEFNDKCHLRRHRKLHVEETAYLCQECGKGYKVWDQLRIHMWSHDEELYKEKYGKYKQNAMKRKSEGGGGVRRKTTSRKKDVDNTRKDEEVSSSLSATEPTATHL